MERLKKQFVMLLVPAVLILFAAFLAAQGPPNQCAKTCQQIYAGAVASCHGDQQCLANARAAVLACLQGCGVPLPPR
jgi:hypothetical protein